MMNITMAGRTGKYVTFKKVELNGRDLWQARFSIYTSETKGKSTNYTCMYIGMSDKLKDELFVPKCKNENGTTEYHSRSVYVTGNLALSQIEKELPIVGEEDEFELVLAPSITVFVKYLEFLDASPKKKEDNGESTTEVSDDVKAKREARKQRRLAQENSKKEVDEDEEEVGQTRSVKGKRKEVEEDYDEEEEEVYSRRFN